MATATASSTSSTAASSGQGADDNYAANGQSTDSGADGQGTADASAGDPPAPATAAGADTGGDDHRSSDPLRAERRKTNQLEKEIRTLKQQLNRFSEINPEEYARLQEAERQKQVLEQQLELRERQMEEASAQKVAAVAAERDEAKQQILHLRKDRLLERAFSEAEGRTGGDARGTFFDIFKGQLGTCFRLSTGGDGKDVLEPLDSQGKPLLGDDGRPMTTTEFLDQMRVHPVYGFLFQQRGPAGMQAAGGLTVSGIGSNGEPINPQAMSASELYRASFAVNGRGARR
ncbi:MULTISPECIES: hypothetical protein [unclassified Cyanobium]|uniref:hypothetical protein n=1 Tax=unclassified Cyanobium TaxID=2627006 RepID=UPI0020CCCAEF|nr:MULTISPECIES: hypothetical protein [unclassified Cyanobium]MCP9861137.1 hypothetical protein [Cyanobium sp. Cruz-8H5]MCP9868378.1 hypothetical protein [Cyanobium sp. Cruz-8D1]